MLGKIGHRVLRSLTVVLKTNDKFHFAKQVNYVEKLVVILEGETKTLCTRNSVSKRSITTLEMYHIDVRAEI